jgi:tRNA(fMet)-specific endonuclease VapC
MTAFLVDTNHLTAAIKKVSPLRDRLRQASRKGHTVCTTWGVLCELEAGIARTADPDRYQRNLRTVLKDIRIWPMQWKIVHRYAEVVRTLKDRGRVLSFVDRVLAAWALEAHLTILTTDRDFEAFPEIRCENWIE